MEVFELEQLICSYCRENFNDNFSEHHCFQNYDSLTLDDNNVLRGQHITGPSSSAKGKTGEKKENVCPNQPASERVEWKDNETRALITAYQKYKEKEMSPQFNKSDIWAMVRRALASFGIIRSGEKCSEKWRSLKKTYERNVQGNKTTASHRHDWIFFNEMDAVLKNSPQFQPIATASNTGKYTTSTKQSGNKDTYAKAEASKSLEPEWQDTQAPRTKKRKLTLDQAEAAKERRHQERMKVKQEALACLKQYLSKKD